MSRNRHEDEVSVLSVIPQLLNIITTRSGKFTHLFLYLFYSFFMSYFLYFRLRYVE